MSTDSATAQTSGNPLVSLLGPYVRPYLGLYGLGLVTMLLARVPQRAPALIIGVAFDALLLSDTAYTLPLVPQTWIPEARLAQLWFTVSLLAVAVAATSALDWFSSWCNRRASLGMTHDLRIAAYGSTLSLEMSYFDDRGTGDMTSVLYNDVDNAAGVGETVYWALSLAAQLMVAFVFMAWLNWQLALALLVVPIFIALTSRAYARRLGPRYDRVRAVVGSLNAGIEDSLSGIRTVKAFTGEDYERDRVADASGEYRKRKWETFRLKAGYDVATWSINAVGTLTILVVGGYWVLVGPPTVFSGSLTAGTLLTFLMYSRSFFDPVKRLVVDVIDAYENAKASGKRVLDVIAHPDIVESMAEDGSELEVEDGIVEFDDVIFTYDGVDEAALSNVDFAVEPGELVGIVGSTGAGKSTLVKLLLRFYEPDVGHVQIDGQDLASVTARSLSAAIGYVSQSPILFDDSVRENIAYARVDADQKSVVEAAKLAGAHEFVTDLPHGYDTRVGERGVKLSGGQRQRVAIARTLFRDPSILVLDEATSHVDNETEVLIQQNLEAFANDRTTFVIAHRLSTVRNADRILVLEDGELVQQGTHEELLDADGVYADLWRVQVGDFGAVSDAFVDRAAARERDG